MVMQTETTELNRVIWMLWFQGFDQAPEIVQLCVRSWKVRNPTWQVIQLSNANLTDYVHPDELALLRSMGLPPQKLANLIRIYLISRHGGVWADATCFCCKPLDNWLPDYMASGFFAYRFHADAWLRGYRRPAIFALRTKAGDKIVANWFLAAVKGNPLATRVYDQHRDFFRRSNFKLQSRVNAGEDGSARRKRAARRAERIGRVLNRNAKLAQWWTSPLITKTARVYPYFIFHYHFARIVSRDPVCKELWARTPVLFAEGPLTYIRALVGPVTDQQIADLTQCKQPFYKLTWKYRWDLYQDGCFLDHLFRSIPE